jgi:hypothetical protein
MICDAAFCPTENAVLSTPVYASIPSVTPSDAMPAEMVDTNIDIAVVSMIESHDAPA